MINQEKVFAFSDTPFKLVAGNSLYYQENTCHRQSSC